MRKLLLCVLVCAVALSAGGLLPAVARAETAKPVAVVSVTSYNELVSDANFIGKLADRPELGNLLEGGLALVTQGKGLTGVDKSRPWGGIVQTDGKDFTGYVFLPITDLKQVLDLLKLYSKVEEQGKGVFKVSPKDGKKPAFVKAEGGWAFFAEKPEILGQVSGDPASLLLGMEKRYVVALRVFAANVPSHLREKALSQFQEKARQGAHRNPKESEEVFKARQKVGEDVLRSIVGAVNDLDQVMLGWALDREAEKTYLDLSIKAKQGTATAGQLALLEKTTSMFEGFRASGATLAANWVAQLSGAKIESLTELVDSLKKQAILDLEKKVPAEKREAAKQVIVDVAQLIDETLKSGKCDGAVTVMLDPHAVTGLAATYVANGATVERILHTVADFVTKENPTVGGWIKFDAGSVKSVHIHTVTIPVGSDAKDREKVVQMFGESVVVAIGVGPNGVYAAAGRDAVAKLKTAIEASAGQAGKVVPPVDISLNAESLTGFIAEMGKPHEKAGAAAANKELKKTPNQDHVTLVARPIPNGVQYHLEIEQGIVRMAGHLASKQKDSDE